MSMHKLFRHPGLNLTDTPDGHLAKNETLIFGFWIFLMSDLIIFGLMFAIYITSIDAQAGGPGPKQLFDFTSLAIQTLLLLTSSLTVGFASLTLKYNPTLGRLVMWLLVTLALGFGFLTFEMRDFIDIASKGGVPTRSGYLSAFYGLVLLHGLHVAMGCLWLIVILVQIRVFGLINVVTTRLIRFSLFWHFLDLIWIGIFSIVFFGGWTFG
ncbi:MAG: cytochrome o ubiquinol oxidase subunit 3 [Paracoccaceae bacterium]|jgi:cytochrome o ubiquinol oxidase subunit 3